MWEFTERFVQGRAGEQAASLFSNCKQDTVVFQLLDACPAPLGPDGLVRYF
jgi:hypothetical protein